MKPDMEMAGISRRIWEMKYRHVKADGEVIDKTPADTFARVARAAASVETAARRKIWQERFFTLMADLRFLPGGRILAGAGTGRDVTLFNCFVMGRLEDSISGIFDGLKESALTMQAGGGIGLDFSTIRPKDAAVATLDAKAAGPVSFMQVWDAMCGTIMSAGARRGAMMGVLSCDHPDIEDFITAKRGKGRLTNFNLSVLVTDAFMEAVKTDADWPLVFAGKVFRTIRARALWERIMRETHDHAEPGVIFIDRVNRENNLGWLEDIRATNPCGEQPLPPYGACLLGSLNLTRFVRHPFTAKARLDTAGLADAAAVAVRLLDNVIDISRYPLAQQRKEALSKRRIGLGVTGLADALVMCNLRYDAAAARKAAATWMAVIERAAYLASTELAAEKGAFALFEAEDYLQSGHVRHLDKDIRRAIAEKGIRNALLTSIAPTGTISLLAGNVSSGIEPIFAARHERRILTPEGAAKTETIEDYAACLWHRLKGREAPLPESFVTARELDWHAHLQMQAAIQRHVDSAISKTINLPADISFADFRAVYEQAHALGLKGCTTYRPNAITGAVLSTGEPEEEGPRNMPEAAPAPAAAEPSADVVYMKKPLKRHGVLSGFTYRIRWQGSGHPIYITINDIIENGRRRPFEIFINSGDTEHHAWMVALARMISAIFRRGGDVSFVVEELKAGLDPRGGQWLKGRHVPSLLAAIGDVIARHMTGSGLLLAEAAGEQSGVPQPAARCPSCGAASLVHTESCARCLACDFSRCG